MQRTYTKPADSKECRPKTAGGNNKKPEKDGIVMSMRYYHKRKLKNMMKMLERILTRLFGDELRAKSEAVVVNDKQPEKKLYDDPDLNILAERYGELKPGKEIMIELGAAAKMLGRKRVRLDAFAALTKKLKNDYGVELKIYSRRTKVEKGGKEQ